MIDDQTNAAEGALEITDFSTGKSILFEKVEYRLCSVVAFKTRRAQEEQFDLEHVFIGTSERKIL